MHLPDTIELPLKARHFENATFDNCFFCAISMAIKERLNLPPSGKYVVETYVNGVWVHLTRYGLFNEYREADFNEDHAKSIGLQPEAVVRTVILTKQQTIAP